MFLLIHRTDARQGTVGVGFRMRLLDTFFDVIEIDVAIGDVDQTITGHGA